MASVISAGLTSGTSLNLTGDTSGQLQFQTNGTTAAMTIDTSQNVGIGTSSPVSSLTVNGNANLASGGFLAFSASAPSASNFSLFGNGSTTVLNGPSAGVLQFNIANSEKMRLDSSGNLGLGVTPSAWGGTSKAIQLPVGAIESRGTTVTVAQNAYFNGTSWIYYGSAAASLASQSGGVHYWYNAPSGTAGNAISLTQAMTLDGNGNLGIGVTSPATRLHLDKAVSGGYGSVILVGNSAGAGADRSGIYGTYNGDYRGGITFWQGSTGSVSVHVGNNASPGNGQALYVNGVDSTAQFAASISVGNATPSNSGAGITFPATQSASSNANTLDDYEEGTFTPQFSFAGGQTGITYGNQTGRYTKVGRVVTIQCYCLFSNKGSSTGQLRLQNLPFANTSASAAYCCASVWMNSFTGLSGAQQAFMGAGDTYLGFYYGGTGVSFSITNTNTANNSDVMVNISYITD